MSSSEISQLISSSQNDVIDIKIVFLFVFFKKKVLLEMLSFSKTPLENPEYAT